MGKESIKKEKSKRIHTYQDITDLQLQLLKMTKQFRDHTEITEKANKLLAENITKIERMLTQQAEREYSLGEDLRRLEEENKNLRRELEEFNSFKKSAIWRYLTKYRRFKSFLKEKTGVEKNKQAPVTAK